MSDSEDDDNAADVQAQVATLLGPMNQKLKKAQKRADKLEAAIEELKKVGEDVVPAIRKELSAQVSDTAVRLERAQAELAQCASKTSLEVARQESQSTEQRLRTSLDESRSRLVAQELVVQGLEARIAAMESATKAKRLGKRPKNLGGQREDELTTFSAYIILS